jgi:nitrite reductase/ring-hydroxylating ferredoxin subunit
VTPKPAAAPDVLGRALLPLRVPRSSGDPSIVIQPKVGTFVAFDAVCPHAGCTVGYDAAQKVVACQLYVT